MAKWTARTLIVLFGFIVIVGFGVLTGGGCIIESYNRIQFDKASHQPVTNLYWVGNNPTIVASYPDSSVSPINDNYWETAPKSTKTWVVNSGAPDGSRLGLSFCYELKDSITVMRYQITLATPNYNYVFADMGIQPDGQLAITWKPRVYGNLPYFILSLGILIIFGSLVGFAAAWMGLAKEFNEEDQKEAVQRENPN